MKNGMMISCKEATILLVMKNHETLSMWDKMRLSLHLSMCRFCSLFEKQNNIIDKKVAELDEKIPSYLTEESKEKILHQIEN